MATTTTTSTTAPTAATSTPAAVSATNTTTTTTNTATAAQVTKPRPVIHQNTNRNSSGGGIFPIPLLRRQSDAPTSPTTPGGGGAGDSKKNVPSSPPVANRRGSMPLAADGGVEWDVERGGVRLEDLRASRRGSGIYGKRRISVPPAAPSQDGDTAEANGAGNTSPRPDTLVEEDNHGEYHPGNPVDPTSPIGTHPNPLGEDEEEDDGWDHFHPCFPHPNPHVPLNSDLYTSTRIIRIPRNYMAHGDNAPAYSIIYPDLLKAYMTEEEFRAIVDGLNEILFKAFDPWNKWNWLDAVVGLLTFWMWEELVETYVKRRLKEAEALIEMWNGRLEGDGVRVVGLRRTGYISLDIQIPDPLVDSDSVIHDGASQTQNQQDHSQNHSQNQTQPSQHPPPPPPPSQPNHHSTSNTTTTTTTTTTHIITNGLASGADIERRRSPLGRGVVVVGGGIGGSGGGGGSGSGGGSGGNGHQHQLSGFSDIPLVRINGVSG